MNGAVIGNIVECEQLTPEWHQLRAPGTSRIFTSPWWAIAAWRSFPDLGPPRLVTVSSSTDGRLLGVLPLTDRRGQATWAGSPLGDEHDAAIRSRAASSDVAKALAAVAVEKVGGHRCLVLHDVRPAGVLAGLGDSTRGCPAPVLNLNDPDQEFGELACIPGWSRTRRRGLRSRRNVLRDTGDLRMERLDDPVELARALPGFVKRRLTSWAERGRLAELPFMDRHPGFFRFISEVASGLATVGRCHLTRLVFDDHPIAEALFFRTETADLLYMSTYDGRFARYSPSHLLLAAAARAAWGDGRKVIELGRGDEPYKFDHGAIPRHLRDVQL